jgi:hypothetical protein
MTTVFNLTRNQIIFKACRLAGVLEQGDNPEDDLLQTAADSLNLIVKDLEVHRKKLWAVERVQVQVTKSDQVTHNGDVYYCIKTHTSGATTEPGVGTVWTDYWYASPILATTTPAAWLTDTAYNNGGEIAAPAGTTAIESAVIREDDSDYPVRIINRFTDLQIEEKWETDRPCALRFDRTNNKIFLYYLPDDTYTLTYDRIRLLADLDTASGTPDVPQTLLSYLILETAAWIGEEYQQDSMKIDRLRALGQQKLALALRNQHEFSETPGISPLY